MKKHIEELILKLTTGTRPLTLENLNEAAQAYKFKDFEEAQERGNKLVHWKIYYLARDFRKLDKMIERRKILIDILRKHGYVNVDDFQQRASRLQQITINKEIVNAYKTVKP